MAVLDPNPAPGVWGVVEGEPIYQGLDREWKQLKELWTRSDNLPEGEVVGALLNFPQGQDVTARYVVTKARPLTLQHIPYAEGKKLPPEELKKLTKKDVLAHLTKRRIFLRWLKGETGGQARP